jgi:hypothetical protein
MTNDKKLLEEYSKEIHGKTYQSNDNLSVAILIESHRHLRELNIECSKAYTKARLQGYKDGYDHGVKEAAKNTIILEDLRKMTIEEVTNLVRSH